MSSYLLSSSPWIASGDERTIDGGKESSDGGVCWPERRARLRQAIEWL